MSESLVKVDYASTIQKADELGRFVEEKKLYSVIQGKKFVNVEGWQFAGMLMGVVPVTDEPKNLSSEGEIKYGCNVSLVSISSGQIVGHGYALCSNKESTKKSFAEYAIASMAQTRAIGKAYRNMLSLMMKSVGFEPTPAEEMDEVYAEKKEEKKEKAKGLDGDKPRSNDYYALRVGILAATSIEALENVGKSIRAHADILSQNEIKDLGTKYTTHSNKLKKEQK